MSDKPEKNTRTPDDRSKRSDKELAEEKAARAGPGEQDAKHSKVRKSVTETDEVADNEDL